MKTDNKKMAVFDLDGTLLNDQRQLSEENKKALQELSNNGYEVVLASGRPEILMRAYYLQLPFVRFVISANGGLIRDIKADEVVCQRSISPESVQKIIAICDKNESSCDLYSFFGMVSLPTDEIDKEVTDEIMFDFRNRILKDRNLSDYPCEKIFTYEPEPTKLEVLRKLIEDQVEDIEITQSSFQALDIMSIGVNKGSAVQWLADNLGIDRDKVAAFGDHLNDLEMIQYAGTGIVCSNAVNTLKDHASHVLEYSNDQDGIAKGIFLYLLA